MKQKVYENYVTNEFGEIDVNYYINRGKHMRSEAIRIAIANAAAAIKAKLQAFNCSLHRVGHA